MTTKEYMRCVTAVDGTWLAELGPMFFSIKEKGTTRLESKRLMRSHEMKMEQEMSLAEQQIKQRKEQQEAQASASIRKTAILTPGLKKQDAPTTPKRTPSRFGL